MVPLSRPFGWFNLDGTKTPYPAWEGLPAGDRCNCKCSLAATDEPVTEADWEPEDGAVEPGTQPTAHAPEGAIEAEHAEHAARPVPAEPVTLPPVVQPQPTELPKE